MISKNEAKYIQSLFHKKQRDALSLFIVEGVKGVDELLNSSMQIQKIYALDSWDHPLMHKAPLVRISESVLAQISGLQTPNKVLAIAQQPDLVLAPPVRGKWILALDGIKDPGNMGTLIRIADWFGIQQVIASDDSVEFFNPKVIQSTMGSFARVSVGYTSLVDYLTTTELPVLGALLNGNSIYQQPALKEGVLLIGNESNGINETLLPLIRIPVSIPRLGGAESLNAAVAGGILLSHLLKPS